MTDRAALAASIVGRLRDAGHTAYFAGGCVRDRLLGREPQDYDVATSAPPETVRKLFARTVPVGMQFGVVLVMLGAERFEVATFRADDAYVDGRRPTAVHFGTPEDDAQRRDFTINAMYLDPLTDEVIDFVGGRADLAAGVIRAIGDARARIAEDRLRMLRCVRFAARLNYVIDAPTFAAVSSAAASITDIAWERIGNEIMRMLTETEGSKTRRAFELLDQSGLLAAVLPEVVALKGVEQSPDYHPEGDVFVHTLGLLERFDGHQTETLALGALLH